MRISSRVFIVVSIIAVATSLATAAIAAARAAGKEIKPISRLKSTIPSDDPPGEGPWVVIARFGERSQVEALASRAEPWEVDYTQRFLVVEADRQLYDWMLAQGFQLQIDEKLTERYFNPPLAGTESTNTIPGYPCYRTVEETYANASDMAAAHPTLASWVDIGDTWKRTQFGSDSGYDLRVLQLSNKLIPGPKPKIFIMSSIHAREYAPAELNTRFAEYLLANYSIDADVTWLLDYHEIHLLLQANPDGRERAQTGLSWRKNTNNNYCSDTSLRGADLNRNFPFAWGCCNGSSTYECSEVFRGSSPVSEPETQAIVAYVRSQFPDQRAEPLSVPAAQNATGIFIDLHSYGELVLWPWGFTASPPPNAPALQTFGRRMAYFNHYSPDQSIELYPTDGTTDDFAYGELGLAAYTFELGTFFFQDCATFEDTIYPQNLAALIYAAKNARAPYLTPSGPEALNVSVTPVSSFSGELLTLNANLDDSRYYDDSGSEPIQAIAMGEYYLDTPPWVEGAVGFAVYPVDGAYDEPDEEIIILIPNADLIPGRHTLYIRAQDEDGLWGPVSAAFFYIHSPAGSPQIEGFLRDQSNNQPVLADITVGPYQTQSDSGTGFYQMALSPGAYSLTINSQGYATISETIQITGALPYRADRYLLPYCNIFSDNVENGTGSWSFDSTWGITDETSFSPNHSWTESPGGNYTNNLNAALTSPGIDLSGFSGTRLEFHQRYATENGWDFAYVESSPDGGNNWNTEASFTGLGQSSWITESLPLSSLDGSDNAQFRFRFESDEFTVADGWNIDDIYLKAAGLQCAQPISPTASFTFTSPTQVGNPIQFVDLTLGTPPLVYDWDFGDDQSTTQIAFPTHTYETSGTFTVTLQVTNTFGSDAIQLPLEIKPTPPANKVYLGLVFTGPPNR